MKNTAQIISTEYMVAKCQARPEDSVTVGRISSDGAMFVRVGVVRDNDNDDDDEIEQLLVHLSAEDAIAIGEYLSRLGHRILRGEP